MRKLFISYARDSRRDIDQLVEHLGMLGYETWFDTSLRGGQDWWAEILRRIADCDAFIAIISRNALDSTACRHEFEWADALGKPVLPIAVEPVTTALPRRFATRHIVDYSDPGHRDRAAVILSGGLATLPPAPALPEPLPPPPATPLSYLTDLIDLVAEPNALSQQQQRDILTQLEPALSSVDPQERRNGRDIVERFSRRRDLYADVDRTIARLRTLPDQPPPVTPDDEVPQSDPPTHLKVPPTDPPGLSPSQPLWQRLSGRSKIAAAAGLLVVIAVVVAAAVTLRPQPSPVITPTTTSAPPTAPPVAVAALDGLLLSPAEVNTALGVTSMTVSGTYNTTGDDSAVMSDKACLFAVGPVEAPVYTGSGWTALRGTIYKDDPTTWTHYADQEVVLFPSTHDAAAFFAASAQSWPACSNRSFTTALAGKPDNVWTVGPLSNTNGTLSISKTREGGNGYGCQRALTVRNNVAIDIQTCSYTPSDSAVGIAQQIAAKLPT